LKTKAASSGIAAKDARLTGRLHNVDGQDLKVRKNTSMPAIDQPAFANPPFHLVESLVRKGFSEHRMVLFHSSSSTTE